MSFFERVVTIFSHEGKAKNTNSGNPNIGIQQWNLGQPIGMPRNYAGFAKDGYRKNGTVYNCINKIAGTASGIKWKLYTDSTMKKEITSHPLLDLWKRPESETRDRRIYRADVWVLAYQWQFVYVGQPLNAKLHA